LPPQLFPRDLVLSSLDKHAINYLFFSTQLFRGHNPVLIKGITLDIALVELCRCNTMLNVDFSDNYVEEQCKYQGDQEVEVAFGDLDL
jgi:hypothetical protein